jgi:hypothetical protein
MQFDVNIRLYEYGHEQVKISHRTNFNDRVRKVQKKYFNFSDPIVKVNA